MRDEELCGLVVYAKAVEESHELSLTASLFLSWFFFVDFLGSPDWISRKGIANVEDESQLGPQPNVQWHLCVEWTLIWWFPKMGVPQIIHFSGIFPNKNHPFGGIPMFWKPPSRSAVSAPFDQGISAHALVDGASKGELAQFVPGPQSAWNQSINHWSIQWLGGS